MGYQKVGVFAMNQVGFSRNKSVLRVDPAPVTRDNKGLSQTELNIH